MTHPASNILRPKIAFIVSKFPCYDEAFILREIYALSKKMDIFVFSLKKSEEKVLHDQARELSPRTIYVPYFFSLQILAACLEICLRHPLRYWRALKRLVFGNFRSPHFLIKSLAFFPKAIYLARWLQKSSVTHIHAYWATYPASVALVASEITGIPFSFTGHAHDIYLDTTHLKEKIMRSAFVTTCTQQNKTHLMNVAPRYNRNQIIVNYHGVELSSFDVNGKVRNKRFEILSVGTLHYYKGFQYLIPALGLLRDKGLDFKCTIVGGGPLESDLRKHIRLLNLEPYVLMTGPLKQSEILPYYKRADLLVLMAQPEWHWGIPNVLIEALAAKTPVITTRFGSVDELVKENETGLLVAPRDPPALAAATEKLYRDDFFRQKLAEAGCRVVSALFDLDRNIEVFRKRLSHENAAIIA
ncbi:MAG: glycosyltransferase [Candidatus Omnitrophica bacterium]|nr:glycosyltransferase [Candidatus Omnitrophota bacterium]